MTTRQIRRAAERKIRKQERKAANGCLIAPDNAAFPEIVRAVRALVPERVVRALVMPHPSATRVFRQTENWISTIAIR